MPVNQLLNARRCSHVHYSGQPCRAPARRGRPYCMFHESAHAEPGDRPSLPLPEDEQSMAIAILRVVRAVTEGNMEPRRAAVALYGLQLASSNLKRLMKKRAQVEDPEAAIEREMLDLIEQRRFLKYKPAPSKEETAAAARDWQRAHANDPAPDAAPTPDPMIRRADQERADDIAAERIFARANAAYAAECRARELAAKPSSPTSEPLSPAVARASRPSRDAEGYDRSIGVPPVTKLPESSIAEPSYPSCEPMNKEPLSPNRVEQRFSAADKDQINDPALAAEVPPRLKPNTEPDFNRSAEALRHPARQPEITNHKSQLPSHFQISRSPDSSDGLH